ncbi:MAG: 30S ribosomal protein S20 [Candidatus Roizmanbacteria bacterium]|nr:30S ribosomal protein S20 [Candidatus Roizmanbacteria bacterium]
MPIIKSAKKKLRQDQKRTTRNKHVQELYKQAIKITTAKPTKQSIAEAYSAIDTAAKQRVIHKNKAARLKKQVARHA